jgi:(p)ppGpp synthase/HD superfamily hydrolase
MNTELMTFGFEDNVLAAYLLAVVSHKDQLRRGWEKYYLHCGRVGRQLQLWGCSEDVIIAGILHDIIEDGHLTAEDLAENGISSRAIALVQAVTKTGEVEWDYYIHGLVIAGDVELLLLKLADLNDNGDMRPKDYWDGWEEALLRYARFKVMLIKVIREIMS